MQFYGKLFRFSRAVLRIVTPRYRVLHTERIEEPAVYVCRHAGPKGVMMALTWLPVPVHTWGLGVFADVQASYKHLREITFIGRLGWPRWLATLTARFASIGLAALYRSGRIIPVYRHSGKIRRTLQQSLEALKRGKSLLIFPDRDYANSDAEVTDLYKGFLRLDLYYYQATGRHIPFIALYGDRRQHTLTIYEALRFSRGVDDEAETAWMISRLKGRLSGHDDGVATA